MAMRTLLIALAASLIACASAGAETPVSLSPSELTAAETATYQTLKDAPAQKSFDTRGYYRLCQKVLGGELPALDLPNMPRDYNYDYVTKAEQKVVQDPLMKSIAAQIDASSPKR
jgi:hypothetical protein